MVLKQYQIFTFLVAIVVAWPSYKKDRSNNGEVINTAMVHTDCCFIKNTTGPIISYAEKFTHQWNMYEVDNCYQNPDCPQPPYYPTPPPFANRSTSGKTFYDVNYRGGSQKQEYYDKCIPIFPDYSTNFSCNFYLIKQQGKAFMTSKGAHPDFGDCCILAQNFHPPEQDFTKHMNYGGIKVLGGQTYYQYSAFIPESGGPFIHGFWTKPTPDKNIVPGFFYMVGTDNILLFQSFKNYSIFTYDSEKVFTIPNECRSDSIKFCPGFDLPQFKRRYITIE